MTTDIDCLARTVWGEARSCGVIGMRHVASVIVNRADHPRWWGRSITGVCTQPWQFSCRNMGDPNLAKLQAVTPADPQFAEALSIARTAVAGQLVDETHGADSYYAATLHKPPYWAEGAYRTMADGWHVFCRTTLAAPPGTRPDVPNVSLSQADVLNQAELDRLRGLSG